MPEWSKGVDSSSTSASCVGSNPTGVNYGKGTEEGRHVGDAGGFKRCGGKSTKSTNRMEKSSRNEGGKKTEMENEVEMTQGNGESGVGG